MRQPDNSQSSVMPEGSQRTQGRYAQQTNIMAAQVVAETVRTTLGPKGMDKMLVDSSNEVTITNDGVTILEQMAVEHPSAKMIVDVARTQESEVGDGTTSAVVVAGELLKNADKLLESNVHPTVITKGFQLACAKAQSVLAELARPVSAQDHELLGRIASTAMTGKGAESAKETLSKLTIKALQSVSYEGSVNKDDVKLEKKTGGSVEDSEFIEGLVLDKARVASSMPASVSDAKIALIDAPIEVKGPETDTRIQISDPAQLQSFIDQEEQMLKRMVESITASGADVVFCQKGIDEVAQHFLSKQGILAVRRVKKSDMEALAKATGGQVVTNVSELSANDLGNAGVVQEQMVSDDPMIFVRECENPRAVTLLLKGATDHVVDEIRRAVEDALGDVASALKEGRLIGGAGSAEIELIRHLRSYAESFSGREQLAITSFADALEIVPKTLAENAGLDPIDSVTELKAAHDDTSAASAGINVFTGKIEDVHAMGVLEPLQVKKQALSSASEVAEMILRIDDVIWAGASHASGNERGME